MMLPSSAEMRVLSKPVLDVYRPRNSSGQPLILLSEFPYPVLD